MFDIDAGHAHALRLIQATDTDAEIAAIERQMEVLSLRHYELSEAKRVAHAQSRPIRVSAPALSSDNDFWTHRHRVMAGADPKIARSTGQIEFLHEDDGA